MDGALITLSGLIVINIAGVAFSYGLLSQKVMDMNRRVTRIENKMDRLTNHPQSEVK